MPINYIFQPCFRDTCSQNSKGLNEVAEREGRKKTHSLMHLDSLFPQPAVSKVLLQSCRGFQPFLKVIFRKFSFYNYLLYNVYTVALTKIIYYINIYIFEEKNIFHLSLLLLKSLKVKRHLKQIVYFFCFVCSVLLWQRKFHGINAIPWKGWRPEFN